MDRLAQLQRVELLESMYNNFARIPAYQWGERQEQELSQIQALLLEAYDLANVPSDERIVGI